MSTGLRLIDFDYHYLDMDDADFEYPEHIGNLKNHMDLHKFIVDAAPGAQMKLYTIWEDGLCRLEDVTAGCAMDISLAIYIKSPELQHIMENYEVGKEGILFRKRSMTREKYNKHLQFGYDEDKVYPEVCEKCGCLMGCSREHWDKRNKTWQRLKCSDSLCGNIRATQRFVDEIKPKNMAKLKERIGHLMQQEFDFDTTVYVGEKAGVIYQKHTNCRPHVCQECGGTLSSAFIVKSGPWYSFVLACDRCQGSCGIGGFQILPKKAENELCDKDPGTTVPEMNA